MFSTLKLRCKQNKPLIIATLLSLLLHVSLLSEFSLHLPFNNQPHHLEIRLANAPAVQKSTPASVKSKLPAPQPKPQSKTERTNSEQVVADSTTHDISPLADIPVKQESASPDETQTTQNTEQAAEATDIAPDNSKSEPRPPVYQYVETEFEVRRGTDASAAGTVRVTFNIDKDGSYQINSKMQAKGLVSLFINDLVQTSQGSVSDQGLVPNYYSYQYGNDKTKIQSASFAWSDRIIVMRSAKGEKTEPLITGTQDFLSFMYQFMFSSPLENMQITMTNGKRLRTYTYSFSGEERITTKIGKLNAIHLLKEGDEEEKTELWLATDYQYLPIKIRKTEKDGSVIEQSVTSISTQRP